MGGGGGVKGQPVEGGSRAGMPETMICEPSIVAKHLHDKPKPRKPTITVSKVYVAKLVGGQQLS